MRQLPPRRLNAIGAAVSGEAIAATARAALAKEATFQQQLKEANLRIPAKDAMRKLAQQMQQNLDAELKIAVERFLGFEVTDPQQVKGRLAHVPRFTGTDREHVTYMMDGVPVLKTGPQLLERRGDAIHAYQLVEQLLPEDYKPSAAGGIILP